MHRALIALILACLVIGAPAQAQGPKKLGHYLFVWTQDRAKESMDFLAVIDADPASPAYGKLVTSAATDQKSNNAHHTEYEMPASGMLFANDHGANRTIIFDLNDPLKPRPSASFGNL